MAETNTLGGVDINVQIPVHSALNLALGLCIPMVVCVLLLIFYNKIK
ncbi:MAG: hypothetical protein IKT77_06990 [Paludibacteraceae bacterium]|nr:hypothetical protein [Paludibacteraceae bacterium]MBR6520710.1 hypothetical protein [Paludibacteraceae bacterium]